MASASLLEVLIGRHRSGMLLMEAMSSSIMAILLVSIPWSGRPMVRASLHQALIKRCKYGAQDKFGVRKRNDECRILVLVTLFVTFRRRIPSTMKLREDPMTNESVQTTVPSQTGGYVGQYTQRCWGNIAVV